MAVYKNHTGEYWGNDQKAWACHDCLHSSMMLTGGFSFWVVRVQLANLSDPVQVLPLEIQLNNRLLVMQLNFDCHNNHRTTIPPFYHIMCGYCARLHVYIITV